MNRHFQQVQQQADSIEEYAYNSGFFFGAISGFVCGVIATSVAFIAWITFIS